MIIGGFIVGFYVFYLMNDLFFVIVLVLLVNSGMIICIIGFVVEFYGDIGLMVGSICLEN